MAQEPLFDHPDGPVIGLTIKLEDHALTYLEDATTIIVTQERLKNPSEFVGRLTLAYVEQDFIYSIVEDVIVAARYGKPEDVRRVLQRKMREAREHRKKHEIE